MSGHVPRDALLAVLLAFALQLAFWWHAYGERAQWAGVPPPPDAGVARTLGLGDPHLLYRSGAYMLQNLGDRGGDFTPLLAYDYARLERWFRVLFELDERSSVIPFLAGYYYSQSGNPDQVAHVVRFLETVATRDPQHNWRWLAHAVYLAKHRMDNSEYALKLAYRLAAIEGGDLPSWTRQLPAFVLADVGEKEAARDILEVILATDPNLPPEERAALEDYIERRLE